MNLYLAPMEGITTHIYRNAFFKYYGGFTRYYTPFLSNKVLSTKEIRDVHPDNNPGIPLVPQILTNQSDAFLAVAKHLQDYGYTEVNLNLGCPSGTVVAKKRGAGFLDVPDQLDRFLDEIFSSCQIDISIKTRLGIESEWEWEDLLNIYKKYPIKEMIIHPRYQKEFYNGTPHRDAFSLATDILSDTSISLCYNGDIITSDDYEQLQREFPNTACMIGRGAIANPELPGAIANVSLPEDSIKTLHEFHDEILEGYRSFLSGDQPVLFKMKELWAYLKMGYGITDKMLKKIRKANRLAEYQAIMNQLFNELSAQ